MLLAHADAGGAVAHEALRFRALQGWRAGPARDDGVPAQCAAAHDALDPLIPSAFPLLFGAVSAHQDADADYQGGEGDHAHDATGDRAPVGFTGVVQLRRRGGGGLDSDRHQSPGDVRPDVSCRRALGGIDGS